MIDRAAAVAAQHAGGMGVVHHHDGAVLFRRRHQAGQWAMSPSIEKTPSEISSFFPPAPASDARMLSAAATSLCAKT